MNKRFLPWFNRGRQTSGTGPFGQMIANQQEMQDNQRYTQLAGAAFGAANLFMGAKQMGDAANAINTTAPSEMVDASGRPVYNVGQFAADTQAIDPQGATGGEILSGAGQGAAIGGAIVPGLGHAIGAVGGALVNVFGGARRKRKMREKKRARARNLSAKQGRYNRQMQSYNSERLAQESYQKGLDNTNRLYNIYNTIT